MRRRKRGVLKGWQVKVGERGLGNGMSDDEGVEEGKEKV